MNRVPWMVCGISGLAIATSLLAARVPAQQSHLSAPTAAATPTNNAKVAVPNVVGLTEASAATSITAAGLTVGTVAQAFSTTVDATDVVSQKPAADKAVAKGTAVNLVVSSTFTALSSTMIAARVGHTETVLPNGQVLLTGGCVEIPCTSALNSAELYNPETNTYTPVISKMISARVFHTANLLPNGQVLVLGGWSSFTSGSVSTALSTAEVYNPVSQTFTALSATMLSPRALQTATLLSSGDVLITGGEPNNAGNTALKSAELYDPVANSFAAVTAKMKTTRAGHTGTRLPNGEVLITGGDNGSGTTLSTAEVYDPVSNTFKALAATMTTARAGHASTLLPDGLVLVSGGGQGVTFVSIIEAAINNAELYNPNTKTFTALTAMMMTSRAFHKSVLLPTGQLLLSGGATDSGGSTIVLNTAEAFEALPSSVQKFTALTTKMTSTRAGQTATLLPDGQVLLAGGCAAISCTDLNTAELYNPSTRGFTALSPTMTVGREGATATLLPSGKVLIAGGAPNAGDGSAPFATAELYDPVANTFTALSATMTEPRFQHTATLLPNGTVLITGGYSNESASSPNLPVTWDNAEVYDPIANTFTTITPVMTVGRAQHTATLLPNGTVLIAGGTCEAPNTGVISSCNNSALQPFQSVFFNTAELYDPVANTFTALSAKMTSVRNAHAATLLPNGQILLAGGITGQFGAVPILDSAELYDPATGVFTALSAAMTSSRVIFTATLLPNGEVLLAGGAVNNAPTITNTAELYAP